MNRPGRQASRSSTASTASTPAKASVASVTSVAASPGRVRTRAGLWRAWVVRRTGHRDEGRAIVEFIAVGLLVLVPIVYLVVTLGRVQAAAFAVSTAAREAGRAFTTAPD